MRGGGQGRPRDAATRVAFFSPLPRFGGEGRKTGRGLTVALPRRRATIAPMKYAIVIPDGAADEPQDALGGKTPLQAARLPNMDRIARAGVVGRANNVPPSLTPA